jgi:hypothetical protein
MQDVSRAKRTQSVTSSSSQALEAALDLSDGTSSMVVLQGGKGAWASFLPSVLVGQHAVVMLRQRASEAFEELRDRVRQRLANSEQPTQRLLWVTPPDLDAATLAAVRDSLFEFCLPLREVLLVCGDEVLLLTADALVTRFRVSTEGQFDAAGEPPVFEQSAVHWDLPKSERSRSA